MTKAMHLLRKGKTQRNGRGKAKATPAKTYPPGYFTELVFKHNWPPMWQPTEHCNRAGWKAEHGRRTAQMLRQAGVGFFDPALRLNLVGALPGDAPAMMASAAVAR